MNRLIALLGIVYFIIIGFLYINYNESINKRKQIDENTNIYTECFKAIQRAKCGEEGFFLNKTNTGVDTIRFVKYIDVVDSFDVYDYKPINPIPQLDFVGASHEQIIHGNNHSVMTLITTILFIIICGFIIGCTFMNIFYDCKIKKR